MQDFLATAILLLSSTLRLSVPLVLCGLAGLFSERSGVWDIGLEGKMLFAAFAAAAAAYQFDSAWVGLLFAIFVAVLLSLVHGFASVTHQGNQIISGVAINFISSGLTVLLAVGWFALGGRTPQLQPDARFPTVILPFAEEMRSVPVIGAIYADLISGYNILVYVAFAAVPVTWWVFHHTRFGLRLRAVGENPAAVDTAGISVDWLRYRALLCGAILCGIAGAYLSIAQSAGFVREMSAGKGYMALAALIFAKWRPVPVLFACLLFGFLEALSIRFQAFDFGLGPALSTQIVQSLPYVLTVVLLAGFMGRAIPPKAGGIPYTKER